VSLGLLSDNRTQDWGATRFISEEIRGQGRGGRIERKLIYVSFQDKYEGSTFSRE
jgi:hypothetical protein